jgi:hypothetical protein
MNSLLVVLLILSAVAAASVPARHTSRLLLGASLLLGLSGVSWATLMYAPRDLWSRFPLLPNIYATAAVAVLGLMFGVALFIGAAIRAMIPRPPHAGMK